MLNAASNGHVECVKALLRKNVNPSVGDDRGATSLHYSCYYGHAEVVKLLLGQGAKVDCQDMDGCTPLHHACANGHLPVLKLLLKQKGVNVDVTDKQNT